MTRLKTIVRCALLVAAVFLVSGCDTDEIMCELYGECGASQAPQDHAGSFTLFSVVSFYHQNQFCLDSFDDYCTYDLRDILAAQMQANGWSATKVVTDGYIHDTWTSPDIKESDFASTTSNLLYISSHGSASASDICLRQCDGSTWGSDYSISPYDLPSAWSGPNWLVVDACDVVQPGIGWERTFGGKLHGILGYNGGTYGLTDGAQQTFARLTKGFSSAIDAWDSATSETSGAVFASALIPYPNRADAIEAAGGPHYGYDSSTSPQYYHRVNGVLAVQSVLKFPVAPSSVYSLVPEAMNEGYWNSYYGGSNVPSTITHPTSNEDVYRNPFVYVDHYLASGGLMVAAKATGTARGFSDSDAYQYALSWLANNGGLPADAALTFDGVEVVDPASAAPTSDQPFPSVRQYIFVWRHATSGVLDGDRIQVNVDDAGKLTPYTQEHDSWNQRCECEIPHFSIYYAAPWVPVYHVHLYTRAWRTLGAPVSGYQVTSIGGSSAFGLCSSDMANPVSVATPCGTQSTGPSTALINLQSGTMFSAGEPI